MRSDVNNRKDFVPIKDIEIYEILVDEQLFRRRNNLISSILPDEKQSVERRAPERSVTLYRVSEKSPFLIQYDSQLICS